MLLQLQCMFGMRAMKAEGREEKWSGMGIVGDGKGIVAGEGIDQNGGSGKTRAVEGRGIV